MIAAIALDVDWAPDFVIEDTANILIRAGIKATWFVTHDSPAIRNLRSESALFELGIHPNFLAGSTQGESQREIIQYCLNVVPEALSMRTHAYFQSASLFADVARDTAIINDASIFLPYSPNLSPCPYFIGGRYLNRLPVFWEDDNEMKLPIPKWESPERMFSQPGMKILVFHPIHIYLNHSLMADYLKLKSIFPDTAKATQKELDRLIIKNKAGTRNFFKDVILSNQKDAEFLKICEISNHKTPT